MKNLVNLIKLQYYSILSLKKYFLIVLILGFIMIVNDPAYFVFPAALMLMAVTYTSSAYEEKSKMNYLVYSLPIRANDYILSKFLFGLTNTFLAIMLSLLLHFICNMIDPHFNGMPLSAIVLATFFIGIFLTTIVVPLGLIIGFEKGRIIMVFFAVFPACFSPELLKYIPKLNITFTPEIITLLFILIGVTITLASYFLTTNIYSKKDIA